MATTKLYLDCRATKQGEPAPLKLMINKHSRTALLPLDVRLLPEQWDAAKMQVVKHPKKAALNAYITNRISRVNDILRDLVVQELAPTMTATEIKNYIQRILDPNAANNDITLGYIYKYVYEQMSEAHQKRYASMWNSVLMYDDAAESMPINKLTTRWVQQWIDNMGERVSQNTQHAYLVNFFAVLNRAVDADLLPALPIKPMRIKMTTTRKRNLSVDVMQRLFATHADDTRQEFALDVMRLIFLLVGINFVDLMHLQPNSFVNGRIEYDRAKTKRHYSIKVEPEVQHILDKYSSNKLLMDYTHLFASFHSAYTRITQIVRDYAPEIGMPSNVTTYYMRHSWATIAAELDIPKDTIALALGHGGSTVTDVYINYDLRKVDRANRQIIDLIVKK